MLRVERTEPGTTTCALLASPGAQSPTASIYLSGTFAPCRCKTSLKAALIKSPASVTNRKQTCFFQTCGLDTCSRAAVADAGLGQHTSAHAQTYKVLYNFGGLKGEPTGPR
jgi:hypothetical protein